MLCPICNTEISEDKYEDIHVSPLSNQEYKLYYCLNCKLKFWSPLKIIHELYENETWDGYAQFHHGERELTNYFKHFIKNYSHKKGKLLDIGCGDSLFINEMQKYGFDVWGIDFDRKSIETAKLKYELKNIFAMTPVEFVNYAKKENLKFDIITFFEVLEHQGEINEFMDSIVCLLKKGGWIAGTVPNRENYFFKLDVTESNVDLPPHHFAYWSKDVLRYLFNKKGLERIEFKPIKRYPISKLAELWRNVLIGKITKKLKKAIKKMTGIDEKEYISIDKIKKGRSDNNAIKAAKLLKKLMNVLFIPIALVTNKAINKEGYWIFFYAEKHD